MEKRTKTTPYSTITEAKKQVNIHLKQGEKLNINSVYNLKSVIFTQEYNIMKVNKNKKKKFRRKNAYLCNYLFF